MNPEGATEAELRRRTLTNLYNERPTWLDLAHQRLDRAVLDAYGWPHDLSEEGILERLLGLNQERAGVEGLIIMPAIFSVKQQKRSPAPRPAAATLRHVAGQSTVQASSAGSGQPGAYLQRFFDGTA